MKTYCKRKSDRGFTLIELLIAITIMAALAASSLAIAQKAMTNTKLASSVSRARDIGPLIYSYSQDMAGRLPVWKEDESYWWEMIADQEEYDPEHLFKSPGHREFDPKKIQATISYGWNATVMGKSIDEADDSLAGQRRMTDFNRPSKVLVLADGAKDGGFGLIEPAGPLPDPDRYNGKVAALLLDGSARILNAKQDFGADSEWFETDEL